MHIETKSIKHIKVSKVDIHPECHKNSEVVSGLFERFLGKKIAFSDDNILNIFKVNIIKSDYVKVSNAEIGFISGIQHCLVQKPLKFTTP